MSRRPTISLLLLLVAGCAASTAPASERPAFDWGQVGSPEAPEGATSPPTVRVRPGGLEVLGIITTPSPCLDIAAAVERHDRTLSLTITASSDRLELCIGVLGHFAYAADVPDLAAGEYRVIVRHVIPNTGWPVETVLDTEVEVP
jgi:hypothetical protein